ncbi:bifunctional non-homologous end joining protein LigD [Pullulanibacillus pueri]|uniref:DNA ligase D polymerase domain-containing protein n=1 Tax=Pullulanibacillus pueri TaxID=1437324 RepID=A0A8J3A2I7_9BACL|nr:bifunctional non-homologous end joining protein LigD [Pullulanibacillus pueri]GGH88406.1 hypothetical protein GCM10007096_40670 [Pullulanibacillus pueri]
MATQEDQQVVIDGTTLTLTSLNKPLWPKRDLIKADYFKYVYDIAPYMLPFLKNRALTLLRYPHGADGEAFFQKNCPDYAPDFIETADIEGIHYIVGHDLKTLIWLANQLAFEIHVPFQTIESHQPSEIVIDLDPPSRDYFSLAKEAALMLKDVLDRLALISFVKTSGNKGLQLYLPLPDQMFSYEDTRLFTSFLADYLVEMKPDLFTTERLKKNRGNRLYVDYIQHAEGKTIIAPYSVRGNEDALVATPLYWNEVNDDLRPERFPLDQIKNRLEQKGCPFASFFEAKKRQPFAKVLQGLKQHEHKGVLMH